MSRKSLFCFIVLSAFLIGLGGSTLLVNQAAAKTTTINCLTAWPKSAFESGEFLKFIENVQKEADRKYPGELKMVYKGAGEVVATNEQVEACRTGLIDMV